jgi:hypothetical protein
MWILLKEGDVVREGDQYYNREHGMWTAAVTGAPCFTVGETVLDCGIPMRRELGEI